MKKTILILTGIFFILTAIFSTLFALFGGKVFLALLITFATFLYHFLMRLTVGILINAIYKNRMDYEKKWFQEKKFEKKLYEFLRVKKWKKHVPTFSPETFSMDEKNIEDIIKATCQAEVVHLIIIGLSLLPIFASVFLGEFWVFFVTSILSALLDSVFVLLQRFNRPRLLKLQTKFKNMKDLP